MYLKVHVRAQSKKEHVEQVADDTWHIAVREPARRNLANERVREIIAARYGCSPKAVRIVSGHHSPRKILSVPLE